MDQATLLGSPGGDAVPQPQALGETGIQSRADLRTDPVHRPGPVVEADRCTHLARAAELAALIQHVGDFELGY